MYLCKVINFISVIKKIFILLIFSVSGFQLYSQSILTPDFHVISGYVYDSKNDSILKNANIYNKRTLKGTITNKEGFFRFYALPGDTLVISSLGYMPEYILLKDTSYNYENKTFYLERDIYNIPQVNVYGLTPYEQLKYDIKTLGMETGPELNARRNFPKINKENQAFFQRGDAGFGLIMSPFSLLYNTFSKKGKEMRKLRETQRRDRIRDKVKKKYNKEMVMRVTGANEKEALEFMEFCDFSPQFILTTSEYTLINAIQKNYRIFSNN